MGYTGVGCTIKCSHPYYGDECSSKCDCPQELCDFVLGCKYISTQGNSLFFKYVHANKQLHPQTHSHIHTHITMN